MLRDALSNPQDFESLRHASRTIKGIETIQAIYQKKRSFYRTKFRGFFPHPMNYNN